MKKALIIISIISVLGAGTGIFFWMRKPKISAEKIDYLQKSVDYKMSAGGVDFNGTKLFSDKTTTEKTVGDYKFVASAEGAGFVLAIFKSGTMVKGLSINLTDRTSTELA